MVSTNGKRKTSARKVDHTDLVHTGPGTVAGRFLRRFWQPVYLARELKPGQAVPIRIMSEDFTLYRGESGTPHVVGHRCAHRGTQLSVGWVEGDCIRCFYHGWMYDSSGQCVEQPAESEAFARKVKIGGHPTQEYLGLIFAYFGEGEAPPFPTYRDFEDEGFHTARTYTRGCNYFNNIDNHSDEVHVTFTHRESAISVIADIFQVRAEETEYGTVNYFTRANGMGRETHCIMPNLLQWVSMLPFTNEAEAQQVGWVDSLAWRVPIDDETHVSFVISLMRTSEEIARRYQERQQQLRQKLAELPTAREVARAVLKGQLSREDIKDRPDIINVQDEIAQVGQGVVADRTQERLGRSDVGVILFRKLWLRELQALAEGRPVKQWTRPERLAVPVGV